MWTQIILICSMVVLVRPIRNGHQRPNIIYILADDMGWNDVSFHGSDQIPTPNIDALAYSGVILNRHYVQPLCTPSRAALMTGKYPINIGIHDALAPSHRVGLPLNIKILPQYLKEIGYKNHLVGKWHLGFHQKQYTPLQRGFDSHFGYWTGALSYYDHIDQDPIVKKYSGHDMRRNYTTAWDVQGQYATDLFTDEAVRLIENHCPDSPLFLYLAHLATHAGNEGKLLEAPQEEIEKFWYISDPNRRSYAAMVSILDRSVGAVVDALDRKGILENSIIVFLSDNGAPNIGDYANWGSNYPWRGQKKSLWEGAVRTPSLIWSPLIDRPSRVSHDLIHMTDWLPTLLSVAGYNIDGLDIDGVNQWTTISKSKPSVRENLVVDINPETNMHSVIFGQYKFIQGPSPSNAPAEVNKFLNLDTIISPRQPAYDIENILKSPAWRAVEKYSNDPHLPYKIRYIRDDAAVRRCIPDNSYIINCTYKPCLFNLKNDPCEKIDVAESYPTFLKEIVELIDHFVLNGSPNLKIESDPASNPIYFNDTWSTWEDDCGRPLIYLGPD